MSGSFFKALFDAMGRADEEHLERFRCGFPEEVEAFYRFRHEQGYWPALEERWREEWK